MIERNRGGSYDNDVLEVRLGITIDDREVDLIEEAVIFRTAGVCGRSWRRAMATTILICSVAPQ